MISNKLSFLLNENKAIGFHIRDTLVKYEDIEKLSPEDKKKLDNLVDEYKKLGYVDVRTELGPSQSARMSNKQKDGLFDKMREAFSIEHQIKELLKSGEQKKKDQNEKLIKELEGIILQRTRYIEQIEGLGSMSHLKNGKLKVSYQRAYDDAKKELEEAKNKLKEIS